jgi:hypothetical protein
MVEELEGRVAKLAAQLKVRTMMMMRRRRRRIMMVMVMLGLWVGQAKDDDLAKAHEVGHGGWVAGSLGAGHR